MSQIKYLYDSYLSKMNLLSSITNKISEYIPSFSQNKSSTPKKSNPITTTIHTTPKPIQKNTKKKATSNKATSNKATSNKATSNKATSNKATSNKATKKGVPKTIRNQVWRKYCGDSLDSKCFCCDQSLSYECWEAGHVTSEANGGHTTVENLRPICLSCNRSMGKIHMFEFMKRHKLSGMKNLK
jgi:hypothetical protein